MALYLNHGQDGFHYHSRQAGLNRNDLQLVGFGVVAADFDAIWTKTSYSTLAMFITILTTHDGTITRLPTE